MACLPPHVTASELRNELPQEVYETFFKFAFVRNPWDWQVSLYHFMRQQSDHHQHDLIAEMNFEDYIVWRCNHDLHLQAEFVTDKEGNLIVDFVGRFESLQEDFDSICQQIGLPQLGLPHINRSHRRQDYRSYYNDRTRRLVETYFQRDIEIFGYSF